MHGYVWEWCREHDDKAEGPNHGILTHYIVRGGSSNDKPSHCRYIIDTYSNLDVKLVISQLKRFVLTHIPRKWSKIDFDDIVPRILFRVNIWDTPRSYYKLSLYDCPVNVEYTHKVESARSLVGLPSSVTQKELKCYERADYDIRRAIFGEFTNVSKPRTSRAC